MAKAVEVAGDIAAAGSAVSGLILVYVGALSASYGAFQPQERKAVLGSYQKRAWFAFIGLILFLFSVTLSLFGKWLELDCAIVAAMGLLLLGFCWVVATAVLTVLELR